jgi:hypothetical protein
MIRVNANEAIKAFGAAMQAGLDQQPPASIIGATAAKATKPGWTDDA